MAPGFGADQARRVGFSGAGPQRHGAAVLWAAAPCAALRRPWAAELPGRPAESRAAPPRSGTAAPCAARSLSRTARPTHHPGEGSREKRVAFARLSQKCHIIFGGARGAETRMDKGISCPGRPPVCSGCADSVRTRTGRCCRHGNTVSNLRWFSPDGFPGLGRADLVAGGRSHVEVQSTGSSGGTRCLSGSRPEPDRLL